MTDIRGRGTSVRVLRPRAASAAVALLFLWTALFSVTMTTENGSAQYADAAALVDSVDLEGMMATIADLEAFGSREFHLESAREAAEYIFHRFEEMDVNVELQPLMVGDTNVSNVVATIEGPDDAAGTFLFGAHYDSHNAAAINLSLTELIAAPGADDDASGVAAVIEFARILKGSDFPGTVRFVLFSAEEYGFDRTGGAAGSEYFASAEVAAGRTYTGTVVLDMIGYRAGADPKAVVVINEDGCPLSAPTSRAVNEFDIDLSLSVVLRPDLVYSDHSSFWELGIPSMLVIEELGGARDYPVNPYYHSTLDTSLFLSEDQLEAVTQAVLGGLLLYSVEDDGWNVLVFGTVIMLVAIVPVALFVRFTRRRGRDGDDR